MRDPVKNQIAKRRAVAEVVQKVVVSSRRFHERGMTARVLIDREYYDVDERRLDQLLAGMTPAELDLDPVPDDELSDDIR